MDENPVDVKSTNSDDRQGKPPPNRLSSQTTKSPSLRNRFKHNNNGKGNPNKQGQSKPHSKVMIPESISTYSLQAYYSICISLNMFADNITTIYEVLVSRDRKLSECISSSQLKYVALIAAYSRIHAVRELVGVAFPTAFSKRARDISEYLHLPDFIASAIESIGVVSHDDRSYIPWIPVSDRKLNKFYSPLRTTYLDLNSDYDSDEIVDALDHRVLVGYQTSVVRGLKSGVLFRKIDFTKSAGTEHSMVALDYSSPGKVRALTPWIVSEPVAQLGALWGWRTPPDLRPGKGDSSTVHYGFASREFEHQLHLVDLCSASFK